MYVEYYGHRAMVTNSLGDLCAATQVAIDTAKREVVYRVHGAEYELDTIDKEAGDLTLDELVAMLRRLNTLIARHNEVSAPGYIPPKEE